MWRAIVVLGAGLAACQGEPSDGAVDTDGPVDLRGEFPDPPEGGIQFLSEPMIIPAGSERIFCLLDTYEGPDVGIHSQETLQSKFGHHATINATSASYEQYADGEVIDCTIDASLPMAEKDPMYVGVVTEAPVEEGHYYSELPPGMGARMLNGTRVITESHYVNTSAEDILVQDVINLGLIPEDEVETWAAPFVVIESDFSIPPGTPTEITFDCEVEHELNVLYFSGHMHEWGTSFSLDITQDGQITNLIDVPVWDPAFRDVPPVVSWSPGEFQIAPGDVFTNRCEWFNTTDLPLEFPAEMCLSAGMAYPLKVPLLCEGDL